MSGAPFAPGDRVLLTDPKGRRYLVVLQPGQRFSSHLGFILHDDLLGRPEGSILTSTLGARFTVFRPLLTDYVVKMKRGAQVLYPKDLALILMWADVYPGATVVEGGAGSGALSLALLRAIGPTGRLITYEIREDFLAQARKNVENFLGQVPNWDLKLADLYAGIPEGPVDRVLLDLPEGWRAVEPAAKALRPGGILLAFFPTVPQVQQMAEALARQPLFLPPEIFEALLRPWQAAGLSVRPHLRMVAHSGFILVSRRLAEPAPAMHPPAPDSDPSAEPAA
ncbi:MAG: tRNA (adenine-N1)-methyltransferase [candidate division NC10 bacterium]|nr:tRNA (adenine-N1)-methyltransferase [candidate division NC10 bacterium]